jgi:flavin-dependent dehydrogenase
VGVSSERSICQIVRVSFTVPQEAIFSSFPKSCYQDIPAFIIGRAGWDNWMIYKARKEGWPVIDCTPSVMIVHQNHDYSHLPGGKPHYEHPDTNENIRLAGGQANIRYTILDSTHQLWMVNLPARR